MERGKKFILPTLAFVAVLGLGAYGVSQVNAQEDTNKATIIERIAEKFNLNKDEVQTVFDEHQDEMMQKKREIVEEKLNDAVSKGELTEEKKQLILQKMEELQKENQDRREERKDIKSLSAEERRAEMEKIREEAKQNREELEKWAEENGIDLKYLVGGMGMKMGMGPGHGKGFGGGKPYGYDCPNND